MKKIIVMLALSLGLGLLGFSCSTKPMPSPYGERTLHVWLRIYNNGHAFDLDPTMYGVFAPLEKRI